MVRPPSPGASKRPHRRVAWRRPLAGNRRPPSITAMLNAVTKGLETKSGMVWDTVRRKAIVAGYSGVRKQRRDRGLRSDGAGSLSALLSTLLGLVDLRRGFIGSPVGAGAGGQWRRFTEKDFARMAFGYGDKAGIRRVSRAFELLRALGWIKRPRQVRVEEKTLGGMTTGLRSEAAVRWLNLEAIAKACGLGWLLQRDRDYLEGKSKKKTAPPPPAPKPELPAAIRRGPVSAEIALVTEKQSPPEVREQEPPPHPFKRASPDVARAHIDAIKLIFK
jgi:hypothetical protein